MSERQSAHHAARARLQRSLAALTISNPQAAEDREDALYEVSGAQMDQHVHIQVDGMVAVDDVAWTTAEASFPYPFLTEVDPGASDGTIRTPHFTQPGIETMTGPNVQAYINLTDWITDDSGFYTGARFRIGVYAPANQRTTEFSAKLHFTFSGYAAPSDDDSQG